MPWTKEQEQVIESRDKSVLVSAAAGSGKTATLVERIIKKVIDKNNPIDIDSFLVVTFTKAAAAQMRDKISLAIEKELDKNPDNEHLIRQMTLVHQSDITTIDSFCLKIVKENFSKLEIDSSFAIADGAALSLLLNDVMDKMYEKHYSMAFEEGASERDKLFLDFVDIFSGNDNAKDESRNVIFTILNVAESYSDTDNWLRNGQTSYNFSNKEEFENSYWLKRIIKEKKDELLVSIEDFEAVFLECKQEMIMHPNLDKYEIELAKYKEIIEVDTYSEIFKKCKMKMERFKGIKEEDDDSFILNLIRKKRDICKAIVEQMKKSNFSLEPEELLIQTREIGGIVSYILELCLEFRQMSFKEKVKKKMFGFSDIAHFALQILCNGLDKDNNLIKTNIAREISKRYIEIYIDEYQDSNFLQEDILMSIAGYNSNKNNIFMVGDVKQSIYGFRMARPDLFTDKYNKFSKNISDTGEICIELNKNFRSRANILESVNDIFKQIMQESFGGVSYGDNVQLKAGLNFEETDKNIATTTELLIVGTKEHNSNEKQCFAGNEEKNEIEDTKETDDSEEDYNNFQLEAIIVADKINDIVNGENPLFIWDEDKYRKVKYGDIVILGRKMKNFGDAFYEALTNKNIPVYIENPVGYFDATEIRVMISFLSIVDNTYQDIPLAAVLLSPIGKLTEEDLVAIEGNDYIKAEHKTYLFDKCLDYCKEGDNQEIINKLNSFFDILNQLKGKKNIMAVSKLINLALEITNYNLFIMAMPMGNRRVANMLMLIEKAEAYEKGQYKGLFNFLRYVEGLKINQSDFGEANTIGENEDIVRIMTMHKSKGLEFPVVFVSGLGGKFNRAESKNDVIIHNDCYVASNYFDRKNRTIKASVIKKAFWDLKEAEQKSEEQRLLYVAMTRPKEKMYLTGTTANIYNLIKRYKDIIMYQDNILPRSIVAKASSPLDWIVQGLIRTKEFYESVNTIEPILDEEGEIKASCYYDFDLGCRFYEKGNWKVRFYQLSEVLEKSIKAQETNKEHFKSVKERIINTIEIEKHEIAEISSKIKDYFDYKYPFIKATTVKNKMSISDIKKDKMFDGQNNIDIDIDNIIIEKNIEKNKNKTFPAFIKNDEEQINGATKGTVIHKIMELLDFVLAIDEKSIAKQINTMFEKGYIDSKYLNIVNINEIFQMVNSNLGQRMKTAQANNRLYKEQQFLRGISANEINEEYETSEVVLVQGIIDAFFYESDDNYIVLMDYKTDRLNEEKLISYYKSQLDYYAKTLEQLQGNVVKEKIIYSFYLGKEVKIE